MTVARADGQAGDFDDVALVGGSSRQLGDVAELAAFQDAQEEANDDGASYTTARSANVSLASSYTSEAPPKH